MNLAYQLVNRPMPEDTCSQHIQARQHATVLATELMAGSVPQSWGALLTVVASGGGLDLEIAVEKGVGGEGRWIARLDG